MSTNFIKFMLILLSLTGESVDAEVLKKGSDVKVSNIYRFNTLFTGRKKYLRGLQKNYTPLNHFHVLIGSPGIGKSQLAKKYVEVNFSDYQMVWWFDASKNIGEQFKAFALEWNNKFGDKFGKVELTGKNVEQIVSQVLGFLRDTPLDWIIVFDNAKDYKSIEKFISDNKSGKKGHILVTSKNAIGWHNVCHIKKFERGESLEYLGRILPSVSLVDKKELASLVGDYPLALTRAAAFLHKNTFMSVGKYCDLFKSNREEIWEKDRVSQGFFVEEGYEVSAYRAITIILKEIDQKSAAYKLLGFISLVGSQNISHQLLKQYYDHLEGIKESFSEALNTLLSYSLISLETKDHSSESLDKSFSIHELIQLIFLDQLSKEERQTLILYTLRVMKKPFMAKRDVLVASFYNKYPYYLTHTEVLINNAEKHGVISDDYYKLKVHILEHHISGRRNYAYAETLLGDIDEREQKQPIKDDIIKSRLYLNKANYLWWKGRGDEAILEVQKAQVILEKSKDHLEEHLRCLYYLGIAFASNGSYSKSLKYLSKAEAASRDEPISSYLKYNIFYPKAMALSDKGDFKEALEAVNISVREAESAKTAYRTYIHIRILRIHILLQMGLLEDAEHAIKDLYMNEDHLLNSKKHELAGRVRIMEAYLCYLRGKLCEAREKIKIAIEILDQWYRKKVEHRHQALAYKVLGEIEFSSKNHRAALKNLDKAEAIYKKSLKNVSVFEVAGLAKIKTLYYLNLNDIYFAKRYLEIFKDIMGEFHPEAKGLSRKIF